MTQLSTADTTGMTRWPSFATVPDDDRDRKETLPMNCIDLARTQIDEAAGLPALLDASYAAFLMLLPVIEYQQDPVSGWFVPFVMAGPPVAAGRFALLEAPSLPAAARAQNYSVPVHLPADVAVTAVIDLARTLAVRLAAEAVAAGRAGDRDACARAAWHARDLCARLGGEPPS